MDVKLGYKQTDAGVIPNDWEVIKLNAACREPLQNGLFFKPSHKGIGIKLINVGDLYNQGLINSDVLELFDANQNEKQRFGVKNGDIFFTRSSVVPSGIAHCNIYESCKHEDIVFDSHIIRLKPDTQKVVPSYLFRFCVASIARKYLVSHAKTGTMTTIDQKVLGNCPIYLPPLNEQVAIATALSDMDDLLAAQEKLIAKKRTVKLAAMQELLTGKRRLQGFNDAWEIKRMADIFAITTGSSKSKFIKKGGLYWIVDMGSVSTEGKLLSTKSTDYSSDFLNIGDLIMPKDDIGGGNIIGKVAYIDANHKYVFGDHVYLLRARQGYSRFLSYLINGNKTNLELRKKVSGSAQLGLSRKSVEEQELFFPLLTEQVAIAEVLSAMDAEIAILEQKQAKTRALKQGMMQELLTGRVRLV